MTRNDSVGRFMCGLICWSREPSTFQVVYFGVFFSHKMTKSKDKREKVSVASEIDRVEERRLRCHDSIERAEFRRRREELSDQDRQSLEDEMTIMNDRMQKYDKELEVLRGENRRNMMLSVALLAVSALFYYAFIHY
ncbi:coiled-coil domain-containing protein 167 isoform X1 [Oncorhynchus clarkii lewisi]|uniref:coiled-coil domain-containing protein 167 isoform X1 n=1 Tax=Oncorhynchus clarkii lewisi TaxID=490388 RepID=UPI0039B91957